MKDILDREIPLNALVIGMIISRDSDGIRFGVFNGKTVDWSYSHWGSSIVRSTCSNMYLVENPTEKELEIKNDILDKVAKNYQEELAAKAKKKALKRIPKKDLIIGEYYKDDTGRCFWYFGEAKVIEINERKRDPIKSEGYVYVTGYQYESRKEFRYTVSKTLRKIVEKVIPESPNDFTDNIKSLSFPGPGWNGGDFRIILSKEVDAHGHQN